LSYIEWDDRFDVGISGINEQHKQLIGLINEVHEVIAQTINRIDLAAVSKEASVLISVVDRMDDYAKYHFSTEEYYMSEYSFRGYQSHKKEHEVFIGKVQGFQRDIDRGSTLTLTELEEYLKTWIVHHILKVDHKYARHFKKKGVS